MTPHLGGGESSTVQLELAMVVSYRLSDVTIAVSLTVRPQFAIECLRRSNQQGVGYFGSKFWGYSLGVDLIRDVGTAGTELTMKFYPKNSTYVIRITIHQRHGRTDGQTDDLSQQ